MCRLVAYLGPPIPLASLITDPTHSLVNQSVRSKERSEPLNGDGFGVAWYAGGLSPEPAVFRSVTPAWNNRNLRDLCRVTQSRCILAHVRAASPDLPVAEVNCHPFRAGRFSFMHNGDVPGFRGWKRRLIAQLSDESYGFVEGSTDSEHLFALFLDHMKQSGEDGSGAMAAALRATIATVVGLMREVGETRPAYLNLVVSDGLSVVASRFQSQDPKEGASLYLHTGRRYVCENGMCRMVDPQDGQGTVLIASEPLSADPGWETIPPQSLVAIDPSLRWRREAL